MRGRTGLYARQGYSPIKDRVTKVLLRLLHQELPMYKSGMLWRKEPTMTRQTIVSLIIASAVGLASVAITSDAAFAFRGGRGGARHVGGYHGGAHHHHVYKAPMRRGVAVGVGAAAAGAAGAYYYGQRQCGYQPYPPCY